MPHSKAHIKISGARSAHENRTRQAQESAPAPRRVLYLEASNGAQMPSRVESYRDALLVVEALGDFALMEENYRAIGLFTELEKIFEADKEAAEKGSSAK